VCTSGGVCGGDIRGGSERSSTSDSFRGRVLRYSGAEVVVADSEEVAGVGEIMASLRVVWVWWWWILSLFVDSRCGASFFCDRECRVTSCCCFGGARAGVVSLPGGCRRVF